MKASSGLNQWRGRLRFEFRGSSAFLSPAVVFLQQSPRLSAIRASSEGSSRRRGYNESQAVSGFSNAKVQQIASNVLPVGSFVVVTFGTLIVLALKLRKLRSFVSTNLFCSADSFVESG